ncbi:MAG: hypothetical protein ABSE52_03145 [Candidatus Dormibacteria bacterium]
MSTDDLHERLRSLHAPLPPGLIARAQLAAAAQLPPPPPPSHRRRILEGILAAALAAAIAIPLYLTHSGSPTGAGTSGALLVFTMGTSPGSTSCLFTLETEPVIGDPLRRIGTVSKCGVYGQPVIVGDHLVSAVTSAPDAPGAGFELTDLVTGTQRAIPLEDVDGAVFPSPGGIDLAVPIVAGANQLPALDVFDVATSALLRQLEPEVDGRVMNLGGASASAWLSDGIHTTMQCVGNVAASCDYLINPLTGAVHTLVESSPTSVTTTSVEDYGSPDGTEEARLSRETTTARPGGTATIGAGPTGGTLNTVYTLPAAAMTGTLGIEVADDGSLMFQTSFTTDVVSQGRLYPVVPPSGWTLGVFGEGGGALPGGGFAVEATRQVGGDEFQEEVLHISESGSTTVIQGPVPAATNFPLLMGVAA